MKISEERLEKLKKDTKEYYNNIGTIKCPYLNKGVHFNKEGFEHTLRRSWNKGRSIHQQYIRLRLIPKEVEVIKKCHILQEYEKKQTFIKQNINSRWEKRLKNVEYFAFVVLLINLDIKFKFVIKQIEGVEPSFLTVYPYWSISKDGNKIFSTKNLDK